MSARDSEFKLFRFRVPRGAETPAEPCTSSLAGIVHAIVHLMPCVALFIAGIRNVRRLLICRGRHCGGFPCLRSVPVLCLLCIIAFAGCRETPVAPKQGEVELSVLDVGQGLAQLVSVDGVAVAVDVGDAKAGPDWTGSYETLGSPSISAVVLSHSHLDHQGNFAKVCALSGFEGLTIVSHHHDTGSLRNSAGNGGSGIRFRCIAAGDEWDILPGVRATCLWPPPPGNLSVISGEPPDENQLSICLRLQSGNTAMMLTGDIDSTVMRILSHRHGFSLSADILVVPHHGSSDALEPLFYGYVFPESVVISCGLGNDHGHPHATVLRFLTLQTNANIYQTKDHGTITFSSNGEYWTAECCRGGR